MLYVLLILTHTCTNGTLAGILYQWTKCIDNTKDFFSIWPNCVVAWSLSHVQLFVTPWTAAHQASLSFTISQSLLKFKSIELVMLSNHLILCSPLLFLPSIFVSIRVFPLNRIFTSGSQRIMYTISKLFTPHSLYWRDV